MTEGGKLVGTLKIERRDARLASQPLAGLRPGSGRPPASTGRAARGGYSRKSPRLEEWTRLELSRTRPSSEIGRQLENFRVSRGHR